MKKRVLFLGLVLGVMFFSACKKSVDYEDFMRAEQQINEKQKDLFDASKEIGDDLRELMKRYPDKKIKFDTALGLNAEQEAVLLDMVKNEKDPTFKGTLQQIVEKNKQIASLTEEIKKLEDKLPVPYIVTKGDTHKSIAMSFLKDVYNVDEKTAEELLSKLALYDELEVGFRVWLYYNDGVFGSFVTQGTAKISPYKLKMKMRRSRESEIYKQAYEKGKQENAEAPAEKPAEAPAEKPANPEAAK